MNLKLENLQKEIETVKSYLKKKEDLKTVLKFKKLQKEIETIMSKLEKKEDQKEIHRYTKMSIEDLEKELDIQNKKECIELMCTLETRYQSKIDMEVLRKELEKLPPSTFKIYLTVKYDDVKMGYFKDRDYNFVASYEDHPDYGRISFSDDENQDLNKYVLENGKPNLYAIFAAFMLRDDEEDTRDIYWPSKIILNENKLKN